MWDGKLDIFTTAPIFLLSNYFRQKYLEIASCAVSLFNNIWVRVEHSLLQQLNLQPSGTTCIGHQAASIALPHCLELPYWHYQFSIELVSSSARVTSVKSLQTSVSDGRTSGPIDRTPGLPGSDKNE